VLLLVSRGVPMILGGDEARRTQQGNNNPWCQDNEVSWVDWAPVDANTPLRLFWTKLIAFRKRHPALRRPAFFDGTRNERGLPDVEWHGCLLGAPGWLDGASRVLSFTVGGFDGDDDVHVILNMDDQELDFQLPTVEGRCWRRAFDTALAPPDDASEPGREPPVADDRVYQAGPRSAVVLVSAPR